MSTEKQTNLNLLLKNSTDEASFENKYLTFILADGHYAVPILKVQEIISWQPITPLPFVAPALRGLMNLRGRVETVLDLRIHLRLPAKAISKLTSIMVIRINRENDILTMGAIVDQVSSVINIDPSQIDPPPNYSNSIDVSAISGVCKLGENVTMVLDIEKIIDDICALSETGE